MKPLVRYLSIRPTGEFCNTCELSQWPSVRRTLGRFLISAHLIGDLA